KNTSRPSPCGLARLCVSNPSGPQKAQTKTRQGSCIYFCRPCREKYFNKKFLSIKSEALEPSARGAGGCLAGGRAAGSRVTGRRFAGGRLTEAASLDDASPEDASLPATASG